MGQSVHIGITDQNEEGHWRWTDGSQWGFTKWARGQPDNWRNEDCAVLWNSDHSNQQWKKFWVDIACDTNAAYVCSYYPYGNVVTTTTDPNSGKKRIFKLTYIIK